MMKNWLAGALMVALVATLTPTLSEAKRLGGGKSVGMQRSTPAKSTPQSAPPQQAAPQSAGTTPAAAPATAGAAAAAAAPAKRSWMGPLAGLAAGLGLAALMSHLGLGEGFANFIMMALLVVAAVVVVRLLLRRFAGGGAARDQLATAGATAQGGSASGRLSEPTPMHREPAAAEAPMQRAAQPSTPAAAPAGTGEFSVTGQPLAPLGVPASAAPEAVAPAAAAATLKLPEGFDLPAFERLAKMIFIRLQAANDAADLDDLRTFTTPEMFAAARLDIQERGPAAQRSDVERVEAEVIDFEQDADRKIVSVRFRGLMREDAQAPAAAFDEIWHLVRSDTDAGTWAIAGIQQAQ